MAAGRNICRQYRNVLCIIPLLRQLWILRRQIVKACLSFLPGTERASAAAGSCIDHRFPFMPVCTPPPDWRVTAVRDHLRRERSVSRRVPFAQQRILVILPAIVKETLSHARLRSASACGERCRWRCFCLTFPAQTGQPVRFFAFVRFEIAVRQTCPSGQSHQTLRLLPAVTFSGVSAPLSVGCHSAAIFGSILARSLKPTSTFLFTQYGQPLQRHRCCPYSLPA